MGLSAIFGLEKNDRRRTRVHGPQAMTLQNGSWLTFDSIAANPSIPDDISLKTSQIPEGCSWSPADSDGLHAASGGVKDGRLSSETTGKGNSLKFWKSNDKRKTKKIKKSQIYMEPGSLSRLTPAITQQPVPRNTAPRKRSSPATGMLRPSMTQYASIERRWSGRKRYTHRSDPLGSHPVHMVPGNRPTGNIRTTDRRRRSGYDQFLNSCNTKNKRKRISGDFPTEAEQSLLVAPDDGWEDQRETNGEGGDGEETEMLKLSETLVQIDAIIQSATEAMPRIMAYAQHAQLQESDNLGDSAAQRTLKKVMSYVRGVSVQEEHHHRVHQKYLKHSRHTVRVMTKQLEHLQAENQRLKMQTRTHPEVHPLETGSEEELIALTEPLQPYVSESSEHDDSILAGKEKEQGKKESVSLRSGRTDFSWLDLSWDTA